MNAPFIFVRCVFALLGNIFGVYSWSAGNLHEQQSNGGWELRIEMAVREVGRGARKPSVKSVSPRIAERKWNSLFRSTVTGLPLNFRISAPLLSSFSPLFLPLAAACLCVLCTEHAERENREESGGGVASTYNRLPGESIEHKGFPKASFLPRYIVRIYLHLHLHQGFVWYHTA